MHTESTFVDLERLQIKPMILLEPEELSSFQGVGEFMLSLLYLDGNRHSKMMDYPTGLSQYWLPNGPGLHTHRWGYGQS